MEAQQIVEKSKAREREIDISKILQALWRNAALILIVGMLFSGAFFARSRFYETPKYQANCLLFVNSSTVSLGNALRITASDLRNSSELIGTYVAIMQSRANMELVIHETGVPYSYETLRGMVSASAVNSTGLFRITVTSSDPEEARMLANAIAELLPSKIEDIMAGCSIAVVDYAVTPRTRVSPNYFQAAARGLLIGVVLAAAIVALLDLLNDLIRDEDTLLQSFDGPLLASIPDLRAKSSRKYGYGYGDYGNSQKKSEKGEKKST